jgi:hypothetical protein
MRQSTFPGSVQRASPQRVFLLNLILAFLRAPLKRIGELLGLEAGSAQDQPAEEAAEQNGRASSEPPVPAPLRARGARRRPPSREAAPAEPAPPRAAPPPPPERAKEVDEEPVLTAEFAEEGAEDGAGPEIHVAEPWEGYREMKVPEVAARLASASPTELAAVQLYEASHRKRSSVMRDIERRLRGQQA